VLGIGCGAAGVGILRIFLQSRVSEVLAVGIHPAVPVGSGVFIDHGTGLVVGETAVIEVAGRHRAIEGTVDERCFNALKEIGATLPSTDRLGFTRFKEAVKEQFLTVLQDEERAVAALPQMFKGDRRRCEEALAILHRALAARGPLSPEAAQRLTRVETGARHPGADLDCASPAAIRGGVADNDDRLRGTRALQAPAGGVAASDRATATSPVRPTTGSGLPITVVAHCARGPRAPDNEDLARGRVPGRRRSDHSG
jgi:hypothetical protein